MLTALMTSMLVLGIGPETKPSTSQPAKPLSPTQKANRLKLTRRNAEFLKSERAKRKMKITKRSIIYKEDFRDTTEYSKILDKISRADGLRKARTKQLTHELRKHQRESLRKYARNQAKWAKAKQVSGHGDSRPLKLRVRKGASVPASILPRRRSRLYSNSDHERRSV